VFFPRVAISLGNVAFSAPPGMGGAPTLAVQTLKAEVGLLSLLTGQASVRRVVLTRPAVELRVDAQGRRSWDLALVSTRPAKAAQPATSGDGRLQPVPVSAPQAQDARRLAGGGNLAATLEMFSPASIQVVDGSVRYVDERSGARQDVTSLELDLALDDSAGPLTAKGSFAWRGEKVTLESNLSPLRALLEQQSAKLTVRQRGYLEELERKQKAADGIRRVEMLAKNDAPAEAKLLELRDLTIDIERHTVAVRGDTVELTAREFDLLVHFARHPGRVYSREQLLDQVWGYQHSGYDHTVNSHINRLRAKIERDPQNPEYIHTVWGVGYKFAEGSNS
jgi:DNA-binding winged helix-turn-helix (wHTH) protein